MSSPFNACSMTRASASYEHDLLFRSPSDRIASYCSPSALRLTKLVLREKMGGSSFDSSPPTKHQKAAGMNPKDANNKSRSPKNSKVSAKTRQNQQAPSHVMDAPCFVQPYTDRLGDQHSPSASFEGENEHDNKECQQFSRER
jgi:hypothetical protein